MNSRDVDKIIKKAATLTYEEKMAVAAALLMEHARHRRVPAYAFTMAINDDDVSVIVCVDDMVQMAEKTGEKIVELASERMLERAGKAGQQK